MTADPIKPAVPQATLLPVRTAFLIVHGVGQQNKFETLSRFAAGLKFAIEDAVSGRKPATGGAAPKRKVLVQRKLGVLDGRSETYLSIQVPALNSDEKAIEIDVYEYFYQPVLQRQVSVEHVVSWLLDTAKRIRRLYEQDDYLKERIAGGQPVSGGTGDRLEAGYMLAPAARVLPVVIAGLSWLIGVLKGVSATKLPIGPFRPLVDMLINGVYRVVASQIDTLITEFAGDVTAYTAIDPKARFHNLRSQILTGCERRIRGLLEREEKSTKDKSGPYYHHVVVAGHSLGSVVAYDALSWISNDVAAGLRNLPFAGERRITGLVTFGSPLDKIALFFWPLSDEQMQSPEAVRTPERQPNQPATKSDYENQTANFQVGMLDFFHGMRGLRARVASYPSEVDQPDERPLRHVAWLNFYHPRDAIAGHLDAYAGVKNLRRFGASEGDPPFPEAHSFYWYDPGMYDCLVSTFLSRDGILREDRQEDILAKLDRTQKSFDLPRTASAGQPGRP